MGIGPFSYNPHPFSYLQLTLVLAFMMGIAQKSARPHPFCSNPAGRPLFYLQELQCK